MTTEEPQGPPPLRWVVVVVIRLPAEPSRHRVAVWRALHRIGAVSLGQGTWALPDAPVFSDGLRTVIELAERGGGELVVLTATGREKRDAAGLAALFAAAREEEWAEFVADCAKFETEIEKEIRTRKFTLAELEEEEESLERLRRWHRQLRARDVFGTAAGRDADERLESCARLLEGYTERVFEVLHQL